METQAKTGRTMDRQDDGVCVDIDQLDVITYSTNTGTDTSTSHKLCSGMQLERRKGGGGRGGIEGKVEKAWTSDKKGLEIVAHQLYKDGGGDGGSDVPFSYISDTVSEFADDPTKSSNIAQMVVMVIFGGIGGYVCDFCLDGRCRLPFLCFTRSELKHVVCTECCCCDCCQKFFHTICCIDKDRLELLATKAEMRRTTKLPEAQIKLQAPKIQEMAKEDAEVDVEVRKKNREAKLREAETKSKKAFRESMEEEALLKRQEIELKNLGILDAETDALVNNPNIDIDELEKKKKKVMFVNLLRRRTRVADDTDEVESGELKN